MVIGTSLVVYPAAGLIEYVDRDVPVYLIDPNKPGRGIYRNYEFIQEKAAAGVQKLKKLLVPKA